jgi:hypothetical protein
VQCEVWGCLIEVDSLKRVIWRFRATMFIGKTMYYQGGLDKNRPVIEVNLKLSVMSISISRGFKRFMCFRRSFCVIEGRITEVLL